MAKIIVDGVYNTLFEFKSYYLCGALCYFVTSPKIHPKILGVETLNSSQFQVLSKHTQYWEKIVKIDEWVNEMSCFQVKYQNVNLIL